MTKIFVIAIFIFSAQNLYAQTFIEKGMIEYEVKSNIKKTMGNNTWQEMMKDNLPTFKTGYYTLSFADNKSSFKWDHWDEKAKVPDFMRKDDESNNWYIDHNTGKMILQKNIFGSSFNIADSLPPMEWRLTNESRVIAGFNCRKAVTKIFDSVYVFAFYTDEILLPGGPCSFHGLPGTIMGITIPRLFTSWIATKVSVNGLALNSIKPVEAKKYYTRVTMKNTINERMKEWSDDEDKTDENSQQMNRFLWGALL